MHPRCSFCGEQPVVAWFEAPRFVSRVDPPEKVTAEAAWLACEKCLVLVDAGDRETLVERAVERSIRRHPDRPHDRGALTAIQQRHLDELFWKPRTR